MLKNYKSNCITYKEIILMIKRLIFDVDGTLITGVNFIDSIRRTLNKLGIYSEDHVKLFLEGIKTYEQLFIHSVLTIHRIASPVNRFSENLPNGFSAEKSCGLLLPAAVCFLNRPSPRRSLLICP